MRIQIRLLVLEKESTVNYLKEVKKSPLYTWHFRNSSEMRHLHHAVGQFSTFSSMKTDFKFQEHLYNGNYAVKHLLIGSQMKVLQKVHGKVELRSLFCCNKS